MAKRVQEELERRKDEIEAEVLRRVEEAKKVGGAWSSSQAPWQRLVKLYSIKVRVGGW